MVKMKKRKKGYIVSFTDTRKHIIKALETFKKYGNAEITIDEFNKFMEVK